MAKTKENPLKAVDEGLGDVAASAASEAAGDAQEQAPLDGTDYTKVKFVGMSLDSLDSDVKIGDEMTFRVKARIVGTGDEENAKGQRQHLAKAKVSSVTIVEDGH